MPDLGLTRGTETDASPTKTTKGGVDIGKKQTGGNELDKNEPVINLKNDSGAGWEADAQNCAGDKDRNWECSQVV